MGERDGFEVCRGAGADGHDEELVVVRVREALGEVGSQQGCRGVSGLTNFMILVQYVLYPWYHLRCGQSRQVFPKNVTCPLVQQPGSTCGAPLCLCSKASWRHCTERFGVPLRRTFTPPPSKAKRESLQPVSH